MQDKAARSTQAEADELAARKDKANALLAEAEAEAGKLKEKTDDLRAQAEAKLKGLSLDKDTLEKVPPHGNNVPSEIPQVSSSCFTSPIISD